MVAILEPSFQNLNSHMSLVISKIPKISKFIEFGGFDRHIRSVFLSFKILTSDS